MHRPCSFCGVRSLALRLVKNQIPRALEPRIRTEATSCSELYGRPVETWDDVLGTHRAGTVAHIRGVLSGDEGVGDALRRRQERGLLKWVAPLFRPGARQIQDTCCAATRRVVYGRR